VKGFEDASQLSDGPAHGGNTSSRLSKLLILIHLFLSGTFRSNHTKTPLWLHPIAYGIKAFGRGSHVAPLPVTIGNPDAPNINAYGVRDGRDVYVTVINKKDLGTPARDLTAKIVIASPATSAEVIFLAAPGNVVEAKEGITLGGASFADGKWDGKWMLAERDKADNVSVKVPGTSAAVVRISLAGNG
jgi:hypothetical protein